MTQEGVHSSAETHEMLRYLVQNCVTKADVYAIVSEVVNEAKHELKDHTARECAKVKGDLIAIAHRQDEKANEFIKSTCESGAISRKEAARLRAMNPFRQPAD